MRAKKHMYFHRQKPQEILHNVAGKLEILTCTDATSRCKHICSRVLVKQNNFIKLGDFS